MEKFFLNPKEISANKDVAIIIENQFMTINTYLRNLILNLSMLI